MLNTLNHVDICFVIDTTGSMGSFISAAQQHLLDMISLLSANSGIDLQVGLVEFRDHPPQDTSFVTRVYSLTNNLKSMQKSINSLRATGGGDGPEAVYDGIQTAITQMQWRAHSCRFALLVGDSPPHGLQSPGDAWPSGCPCGLTTNSVAAAAEKARITLHALCMQDATATVQSFTQLAIGTGGLCVRAKNAQEVISKINNVLDGEFQNLRFDSVVLQAVTRLACFDVNSLAAAIDCPQLQAAAAIARLGKRGFLANLQAVN
ncbi:MAG: vWA domain-containing protein [Acidobacteriota bacterium]